MKTRVVHVGKDPYDVYTGRAVHRKGLPQSKWANPFPLAMGSREAVIAAYRNWIQRSPLIDQVGELSGKVLACWCAPKACHGDVLAELANKTPRSEPNPGRIEGEPS